VPVFVPATRHHGLSYVVKSLNSGRGVTLWMSGVMAGPTSSGVCCARISSERRGMARRMAFA
jgi:hypothetical protein